MHTFTTGTNGTICHGPAMLMKYNLSGLSTVRNLSLSQVATAVLPNTLQEKATSFVCSVGSSANRLLANLMRFLKRATWIFGEVTQIPRSSQLSPPEEGVALCVSLGQEETRPAAVPAQPSHATAPRGVRRTALPPPSCHQPQGETLPHDGTETTLSPGSLLLLEWGHPRVPSPRADLTPARFSRESG